MIWAWLLRGRLAALFSAALAFLVLASAVGALLGGWQGALIAPAVLVLLSLTLVHGLACWLLRSGRRAYARGDHARAWRYLWFLQIPWFHRYDRDGSGRQAFAAASAGMAGAMLRNAVGRFMGGR